jgi:hypothetical protein
MAYKPDPDPFALFLNATCYWRAAAALIGSLKLRYPYNMPTFVLEAFAIELHLKCLLRVRGQLLKDTHEPKDLFEKLDRSDQDLVVANCKLLSTDPGTIDIGSVLKRSAGVFKNLRYVHEGNQWPKDDKGVAGNAGFYEVIRAIRLILLKINPPWEAEYKRILGDDGAAPTGHLPETLDTKTVLQIVEPSTGS